MTLIKKFLMSENSESRINKNMGLSAHLAVHSSSQAVGSRGLKQLPCPSLVKSDDGSHVVLAYRAIDERGNEDASQPLHAVHVCKRLTGEIPETQRGHMMAKSGRKIFFVNVPKCQIEKQFILSVVFFLFFSRCKVHLDHKHKKIERAKLKLCS